MGFFQARVLEGLPFPSPGDLPDPGIELQYSCLENPMDRGAWWSTVPEVARVGHDLATKPPPPCASQDPLTAGIWLCVNYRVIKQGQGRVWFQ